MLSFGRHSRRRITKDDHRPLGSLAAKYTFFSLCRGFARTGCRWLSRSRRHDRAHNRRAEKVMMPVLDVLQAIPVLGFLPRLVLAMIALFPPRDRPGNRLHRHDLQGQAWNMVFSFHGSLRGIPAPLRRRRRSAARWMENVQAAGTPAAMIGPLVWNSMMSMAGGWFFLTVNEAFTARHARLSPAGIGSYMNEAINQGNVPRCWRRSSRWSS